MVLNGVKIFSCHYTAELMSSEAEGWGWDVLCLDVFSLALHSPTNLVNRVRDQLRSLTWSILAASHFSDISPRTKTALWLQTSNLIMWFNTGTNSLVAGIRQCTYIFSIAVELGVFESSPWSATTSVEQLFDECVLVVFNGFWGSLFWCWWCHISSNIDVFKML